MTGNDIITELEKLAEHFRLLSNRPEEGLFYMREHHGTEIGIKLAIDIIRKHENHK